MRYSQRSPTRVARSYPHRAVGRHASTRRYRGRLFDSELVPRRADDRPDVTTQRDILMLTRLRDELLHDARAGHLRPGRSRVRRRRHRHERKTANAEEGPINEVLVSPRHEYIEMIG